MMEKTILLGVQKKKKPIKRNKKRFLKKVVDYLKSDFYMYHPFISPSPTNFPAQEIRIGSSSSASNTVEIGHNKRLLDKVGDYLKSDSYMYAPLFASRPITSPKGQARYLKKVTMEVSTRILTMNVKDNQSTVGTSNLTVEDQFSEGNMPPERSISELQKLVREETVKHTVYQTCRPSSVPGKSMLDSHGEKLLVD